MKGENSSELPFVYGYVDVRSSLLFITLCVCNSQILLLVQHCTSYFLCLFQALFVLLVLGWIFVPVYIAAGVSPLTHIYTK